jgi:hypothetical protein
LELEKIPASIPYSNIKDTVAKVAEITFFESLSPMFYPSPIVKYFT